MQEDALKAMGEREKGRGGAGTGAEEDEEEDEYTKVLKEIQGDEQEQEQVGFRRP